MKYLYLIGTKDNKQKIGISNDPEKRLKALQTGNPEPLFIHYTIELPDRKAFKVEKHLHREYSHYNIKNEWFELPMEDAIQLMTYEDMIIETTLNKV